jgi:molybdenum cofactor cytidylyltransferase
MLLTAALRIQPKDVIALVGGGGKTSLMFRLANELTGQGRRVITTMTTRIFASQMALAPAWVMYQDEDELLGQLLPALAEHDHVLVMGGMAVEADKVAGVPPELAGRLIKLPMVDAVIIEADGSRRLPFKAPAEHEPVIPAETTLVLPMIGLDVIGQPLAPDAVHRPERVAALTGAALGDLVTPAMVAAVLAHPEGGARQAPPNARLVPFLNKAETPSALAAAREVARLALTYPRVDSVAIGALQGVDPVYEVWGRTGAVILAAGAGSRFGSLKQALPWHGTPLVAHVADQALSCRDIERVAVSLGAGADRVSAALAGRPILPVQVRDWADGQSRSVRAGLSALQAESAGALDAVVFLLADQPGISPALLEALVARHRATLAPIVAPRFAGRRGNPVLFDRRTFPEFDSLTGDIGARPILQAHAHEIAWVDWPTPEITQDVDVAADYPSDASSG